MARDDYVVLRIFSGKDYDVRTYLDRFGIDYYLPQHRRRYAHPGGASQSKLYPLFPSYLFLPLPVLNRYRPTIVACPDVPKYKPILGSDDGTMWRVPVAQIEKLRFAEFEGRFDETFKNGDKVRVNGKILSNIQAFIEKSDDKKLTLFLPLLGGARMVVPRAEVTHAI